MVTQEMVETSDEEMTIIPLPDLLPLDCQCLILHINSATCRILGGSTHCCTGHMKVSRIKRRVKMGGRFKLVMEVILT